MFDLKVIEPIPLHKRLCGVAMLDVLGYSAHLKRWGHVLLFDKMHLIEQTLAFQAQKMNDFFERANGTVTRVTPIFISDTLIIFCELLRGLNEELSPDGVPNEIRRVLRAIEEGIVLKNLVHMTSIATATALVPHRDEGGPVFTYRGALAVGDCVVQPPYYFGEAAIEAARNMERASTGIIWLCPSAANALRGGEEAFRSLRELESHIRQKLLADSLEETVIPAGVIRTKIRIARNSSEHLAGNARKPDPYEFREVSALNPLILWEPAMWSTKAHEILATYQSTDAKSQENLNGKKQEMREFLTQVGAL